MIVPERERHTAVLTARTHQMRGEKLRHLRPWRTEAAESPFSGLRGREVK